MNCPSYGGTEHRWPCLNLAEVSSSIGKMTAAMCNNCLAVRLTFKTFVDGDYVTTEQIVEPSNNKGYQ